MFADLHLHTKFSDGSDSPEQVVIKSHNLGLQVIAITDHDIMDGVVLAREEAKSRKIEVIAGVEISSFFQQSEVHVLGFFKDVNPPQLVSLLEEMRLDRLQRGKKIVNNLQKLGIEIEWEEVLTKAGKGTEGRPHIADVLIDKKMVKSREEAFHKYIGMSGLAYVPRKKVDLYEIIKLILKENGVPVIAHPGTIHQELNWDKLKKIGLKGLEAWHPHHSLLQENYFLKKCLEYDLIPTGGSDYHGKEHKACNQIGIKSTPEASVLRIKRFMG